MQRFEDMLPGANGMGTANPTGSPERKPRTRSGISRSRDQSPPPMTLPARAVATATPCSANLSTGK